jgi:leader peptidase (prepilin peptidase) / N-methyltransferase
MTPSLPFCEVEHPTGWITQIIGTYLLGQMGLLHSMVVVAASTSAAAVATPITGWVGFRQLDERRVTWSVWALAASLGIGAGAAIASGRASAGSLVLVTLGAWSVALAACSVCDWVTHRIPTPLVRQAVVAVAGLLLLTAVLDGQWGPVAVAIVASVALSALALAAWRFAGLGRGDVRLATLGGLGLGWSSVRGLALGLGVFCAACVVQVIVTLARGGDRHTIMAVGPPLCCGFLVAAAM